MAGEKVNSRLTWALTPPTSAINTKGTWSIHLNVYICTYIYIFTFAGRSFECKEAERAAKRNGYLFKIYVA